MYFSLSFQKYLGRIPRHPPSPIDRKAKKHNSPEKVIKQHFFVVFSKKIKFPTKLGIKICRKVGIKTEFPTKSLSFQHIKISIQQFLCANIRTHPLAAHVAFDQGEKVGNELVLDNLLF